MDEWYNIVRVSHTGDTSDNGTTAVGESHTGFNWISRRNLLSIQVGPSRWDVPTLKECVRKCRELINEPGVVPKAPAWEFIMGMALSEPNNSANDMFEDLCSNWNGCMVGEVPVPDYLALAVPCPEMVLAGLEKVDSTPGIITVTQGEMNAMRIWMQVNLKNQS